MRRVLGAVVALTLAAAVTSCDGESSTSSPSTDPETTPFSEVEVSGSAYVLPGRTVYPEGIAVADDQYYVGSTGNGDTLPGRPRRAARQCVRAWWPRTQRGVGIKATDTRLVVANGAGLATVFDRSTGRLVAQFTNKRGRGIARQRRCHRSERRRLSHRHHAVEDLSHPAGSPGRLEPGTQGATGVHRL